MIRKEMIYEFSSFTSLLNSWVDLQRKERGERFTLGMLARRLELTSSSEIINILKGRRPVSHKVLDKIKNYWKLEEKEAYYIDLIAEKDRNLSNVTLNCLIERRIGELKSSHLISSL